jgi:transcriptional regulator with XRE-family HTH domain
MPKRDPLLFGGSAGSIDVAFLESVLTADHVVKLGGGQSTPARSADAAPEGTEDAGEETRLVERWREACRALTGYVAEHHPDLRQPPSLRADLDRALPGALDSPWVAMYGLSRGLALRMLAVLRQDLAPQVPPLVPPAASLALAQELWRDGTDWGPRLARIEAALDRAPISAPERVREALGINEAELARLFGVSRQAVAQWQEFPATKRAKAATVLSIADLLSYRLKPGRLPMVARKPATGYGGLSLLDMIAADRHEELLRLTRESFDFAATA